MNSALIDVREAAKILGVSYHRCLRWIQRNKFGLGKGASKVGWGWVIPKSTVEKAKEEMLKVMMV